MNFHFIIMHGIGNLLVLHVQNAHTSIFTATGYEIL